MADIPLGIYRHYKGPLYVVTGVAQNSTNGAEGEVFVLYVPLELERGHAGLRTRCREIGEFFEIPFGVGVPRFTFLGPSLTDEMIEHRLHQQGGPNG